MERLDRLPGSRSSGSTWASGGISPRDDDAPCSIWLSNPGLPRKEVIQPHLPIRLPCYDFTPITDHTFGACLPYGWHSDFGYYRLSWCDGRCVQGPGTYSPRRADPRLLAIPTSWSRVADSNPNWDRFLGFAPPRGLASLCTGHCSTCVAPDVRAMMT